MNSKAWRSTQITALAGSIGAIITAFVSVLTSFLSMDATISVAVFAFILTIAVSQIERRLNSMEANIIEVVDPPLVEKLKGVKNPYFKTIGQTILKRADEAIDTLSLRNLSPDAVFNTEPDYLREIRTEISSLKSGDKIIAVCGEKDWESKWVENYFTANYEAAARGVLVERIFIEFRPFAGQLDGFMRQHLIEGVCTLQVNQTAVHLLRRNVAFPEALGFAVINDKVVFVHDWRSKESKAYKFTSPYVVDEFTRIFAIIKEITVPYSFQAKFHSLSDNGAVQIAVDGEDPMTVEVINQSKVDRINERSKARISEQCIGKVITVSQKNRHVEIMLPDGKRLIDELARLQL